MGDGSGEFNVPHAFSSHDRTSNFHTTLITDNPFISYPAIFSAVTLPILGGTENTFIKKAIFLRFLRTIIDRFRFSYLSVRPIQNALGRSKPKPHRGKVNRLSILLHK